MPPSLPVSPVHMPRRGWRAVAWAMVHSRAFLLLIPALLVTAAASNARVDLRCERPPLTNMEGRSSGYGECRLVRGSLLLTDEETFAIGELAAADMARGGLSGGQPGEHVYLHVRGEYLRLTDGYAWSTRDKVDVVRRIAAFRQETGAGVLQVEADNRWFLVGGAAALGMLVAAGVEFGLRRRMLRDPASL